MHACVCLSRVSADLLRHLYPCAWVSLSLFLQRHTQQPTQLKNRYHDSDDPHSGSYYTEGKEHEHHSGEYYAGDAAGYGYAPDFSSPPCIEECTEYAEAFNIGEVARWAGEGMLVVGLKHQVL